MYHIMAIGLIYLRYVGISYKFIFVDLQKNKRYILETNPKSGFECYKPSRPVPQLTVTKISTYTIYLYVFITV